MRLALAMIWAAAATDLRPLAGDAAAMLGPGYQARAEADRLTLACAGCTGGVTVDVLIGRQDDGTEARVRSGATTIADLERLCRARSDACRLATLDVAPAVGWVSAYPLGAGAGATAVVLRDGDLLTVRAIADDPPAARRAIDRLLPLLRARVVGG